VLAGSWISTGSGPGYIDQVLRPLDRRFKVFLEPPLEPNQGTGLFSKLKWNLSWGAAPSLKGSGSLGT